MRRRCRKLGLQTATKARVQPSQQFNGQNDPFVERDFEWLAELGFNFVRLFMDYHMWIEGAIGPSFVNRPSSRSMKRWTSVPAMASMCSPPTIIMSQCATALIFNCRSTLCVPEFPPRSRLYGGPNLRRKNRSGRTMKPCAFAACTGRISRSATKVPPIAISVSTCSTNRPSWNRKPAGAWSAAFATPAAEFFGAGGPLQSVRSGFDLAAQQPV